MNESNNDDLKKDLKDDLSNVNLPKNSFWSIYLKIIIAAVADFWGVVLLSVVFGYFEIEIPDEAKSIVGILLPILAATFGWIPALIYTKSKE